MEGFIEFITTMPFWYWWAFAIALLVVELITGSTYFLWPALAALVVGLIALLPIGAGGQAHLILFAAVTVALSIFAPPYVKPWLHETQADHMTLNERGAQKIGKRATVEQAFENGAGKVRLGDTLWLAESENGDDIDAGAQVKITRTEGTKLLVKAL